MKRLIILHTIIVFSMWCGLAMAHALLERSVPASGAMLNSVPATVTIIFDSELEPVFSKLIVKNDQGEKVSLGSGDLASGDHRSLAAKLSTKSKGAYHVYWDVVGRDGHRASGDFTFTVQ
jgi:methionine-rich copper-binding protein CopC